jgi:hypothetical protein
MTNEYKSSVELPQIKCNRLPDPGFQQQIRIAFQADASLKERFESVALPVEAVHNIGA